MPKIGDREKAMRAQRELIAKRSPNGGSPSGPMSRAEAEALTERINHAASALWRLLYEAYEREAWKALGYGSWRAYATAELQISKSHAYRLLDQGRVITAIAEAAGEPISPHGENGGVAAKVTEKEARDIKPTLEDVTSEVRDRVRAGEPASEVVPDVVAKARANGAREPAPPEHEATAHPPEDDAEVDPWEELELQSKEVLRLMDLVEKLKTSDLAEECAGWSERYARLEGRLNQLARTAKESERTATYSTKLLKQIREKLGVERNSQILPALGT